MFGWLFDRTVHDIIRETDIEEADILYAGDVDTPTRKKTVEELDEQGYDVTNVSSVDELEKLDDQTVFYRHKKFTSGMNDEESKKMAEQVSAAVEDQDIDFIQDPLMSWFHNDKNRTSEMLEESFSNLQNVRMAESYSEEEAFEVLEDDQVIAKPTRSSFGNGISRIEDSETLENYLEEFEREEYRLEESVPHEEGFKDCRALVLGDGEDATVLEIAAREDGDGIANNIANGGEYTDPGEIFDYEIDAAIQATEGLEVAAFDYMKTPDGEIVGLEVNSDPGTAINEMYSEEVDVNQEISNYIAARTENEDYELAEDRYMEHLEVQETRETPQTPETPATPDTTQKAASV